MRSYLSLGFGIFVLILFAASGIAATGFQRLAMYYPVTVAGIGTFLSVMYVAQQTRALKTKKTSTTNESSSEHEKEEALPIRGSLQYLAWFLGYIVLISITGIIIATVVFLGVFLFFEARMRWWGILISIVSSILVLNIISFAMNLYWPRSLLGL